MKYRGINYDIGTITLTGGLTRETFDADIVAKEIAIIKNELHCNAIRISGLDINRLSKAAEIALQQGLTVWLSPALHYNTQENTMDYILKNAAEAEKLRLQFHNIIFVVGCELSVFTSGFINGDTGEKRLQKLFSVISLVKNKLGIKRTYNKRLNKFLSNAVSEIRKIFHGQITYASGNWEKINWEIFDIAGVDLYRSAFNKATYINELRSYKKIAKPLCIMEFGCCAYKGADDKGAIGWAIVNWKKNSPELKGNYERDETVQSKYIIELLNVFKNEDVFAAFVFTFISYNYVHNDDPKYDLDMASYGVVKSTPGIYNNRFENLQWIPKDAFYALGNYYANEAK
jgi:hypothetical protein